MIQAYVTQIEHIGTDHESGRELYVLNLSDSDGTPSSCGMTGKYATVIIAWDASSVPADRIACLARRLIDAGGVYFCTWGLDCERVHDIIDEEWVGDGFTVENCPTLMTTWHAADSLADTIWFALYNALPVDEYFDECRSILAVCIGNADWADEVRRAFADPKRFADELHPAED